MKAKVQVLLPLNPSKTIVRLLAISNSADIRSIEINTNVLFFAFAGI